MLRLWIWMLIGFICRIGCILYGVLHDRWLSVPFTDVDYYVFSDAAKIVAHGGSPYERNTYRYPPILAWLLLPNEIHPIWGKVFFSFVDMAVSYLIYAIVRAQGFPDKTSKGCSLFWLFNPISIIISARGNSDSVIALVVLLALHAATHRRPGLTGLFLGLAIHVRLYPIIFSLPLYLSFRTSGPLNSFKTFIKALIPNKQQLVLFATCIWFLTAVTVLCYHWYGEPFLSESILYHLTRKDTRHNYSLFFYLLYLNPLQPGYFLFLPQAILHFVLSLAFHNKQNLAFCMFAQTFVLVTYNTVVTSQYWIWVLSLLPACLPRLKVNKRACAVLSFLWLLAQLAWLAPAYLLEFRGQNTFLFLWHEGIGVFCVNLAVLGRLLRSYDVQRPAIDKKEN